MRIVFHGQNAGSFLPGFASLLTDAHELVALPDVLGPGDGEVYREADAVIGVRFGADCPAPAGLRLFQVPGAGTDLVDQALLPSGAALCNVFEHEHAIAEYVMTALLLRTVAIPQADADLRLGRWTYWAGVADAAHGELRGRTVGLLGYGHIGQAVAERARAFGMGVHVCNRGPIDMEGVDRAWGLSGLHEFMASADFIVCSLPFLPATAGLVGHDALHAMRTDAVLLNVGRGGVVDEAALYAALKARRIGGAVIDVWYNYPAKAGDVAAPARLPFHELDNIVMTPHMSGWTRGTIARRQATMARNINLLAAGKPLLNIVRPGDAA